MENGWIKLHRKSKENEIMTDPNAWLLFSWILTSVDSSGKWITGRFILADYLKLNSSTIYKTLKRLEEKYRVVTLSSNNRFTTIQVQNWSKYQHTVTQDGNNEVTTGEQPSNNEVTHIQEYKNIRIKNKEGGVLSLTPNQKISLKKEYPNVDFDKVYEKFKAWQKGNGREFNNVLEAFRVWLIEDNTKNKPKEIIRL